MMSYVNKEWRNDYLSLQYVSSEDTIEWQSWDIY